MYEFDVSTICWFFFCSHVLYSLFVSSDYCHHDHSHRLLTKRFYFMSLYLGLLLYTCSWVALLWKHKFKTTQLTLWESFYRVCSSFCKTTKTNSTAIHLSNNQSRSYLNPIYFKLFVILAFKHFFKYFIRLEIPCGF